jgi:hypothetical protein
MDHSRVSENDIFVIASILVRRPARYARRVMNCFGSRNISARKSLMKQTWKNFRS